jgi:leader peptidase (prepilin peptidase)/N-methyltransferase
MFLGLFLLYFYTSFRPGVSPLFTGGWMVYLTHVVLLGGLIAASAIDLELWIIPLSICWFVTAVGLLMSGIGAAVLEPDRLVRYQLMPFSGLRTASMGAGAAIGLGVSLILLSLGLIKRSYEPPMFHRVQMVKETFFLGPIIIGAVLAYISTQRGPLVPVWEWIVRWPVCAGVLGSVWGYFVGCGTVWVTRIVGTLAFGKEAMGLGDVHLMGAVGAVIGPIGVVLAFFIAPFYGLAWALFQMLFKKIHQIPYGPFLSMGTLTVMILHDWLWLRVGLMYGYY